MNYKDCWHLPIPQSHLVNITISPSRIQKLLNLIVGLEKRRILTMATYSLKIFIDSAVVQQQSSDNLNIAKQGNLDPLKSPLFHSLLPLLF